MATASMHIPNDWEFAEVFSALLSEEYRGKPGRYLIELVEKDLSRRSASLNTDGTLTRLASEVLPARALALRNLFARLEVQQDVLAAALLFHLENLLEDIFQRAGRGEIPADFAREVANGKHGLDAILHPLSHWQWVKRRREQHEAEPLKAAEDPAHYPALREIEGNPIRPLNIPARKLGKTDKASQSTRKGQRSPEAG